MPIHTFIYLSLIKILCDLFWLDNLQILLTEIIIIEVLGKEVLAKKLNYVKILYYNWAKYFNYCMLFSTTCFINYGDMVAFNVKLDTYIYIDLCRFYIPIWEWLLDLYFQGCQWKNYLDYHIWEKKINFCLLFLTTCHSNYGMVTQEEVDTYLY